MHCVNCYFKWEIGDIKNLEEDAEIILSYSMASNGLAANQSKTVFMLLNMKKKATQNLEEEELSIRLGNSQVRRSEHEMYLNN